MNYKNQLRDGAILAATVLAALLPIAGLAYFVVDKHQWAQDKLAELEPRYARLLGMEAQKADMGALILRAKEAREKFVYPSTQDSTLSGNAAQQKVRDILAGAGLQISSSQVLAAKPEKGYDRIPLSVRAEGDMTALQNALAVLSTQLPVIVVNELDVQVLGGLGNVHPTLAPRLAVLLNLSVVRELP